MSVITARQIQVRRLKEEDQPLLEQMYDEFVPHGVALGLPPRDAARRRAWLAQLREGLNLVAFVDGTLTGHLALMPIEGRGEMAVFVRQDFRRQGIATTLTQAAVEEARAMGLAAIWVLIDSSNMAARHGLVKFGFLAEWEDLREAQMVFPLDQPGRKS
ncbi:MAG: GNAT family N-acetyltransferase [Acidobacteria bacterium]|nr:GNAT family N-acetyltransferase [Acidobacteriota bacterium]